LIVDTTSAPIEEIVVRLLAAIRRRLEDSRHGD
jgi:hypothetical protein